MIRAIGAAVAQLLYTETVGGSNPSSPTPFFGPLNESSEVNLPLTLPSKGSQRNKVAQALARAAHALLEAANAIGGEDFASSLNSPTPPPPPAQSIPARALSSAPSLVEVINELLRSKARAGRSDGYLRIIRLQLRRFANAHPRRTVEDITSAEVERWIDSLEVSSRHRQGHLETARLLFSYALNRGYITRNPAAPIELPGDSRPHACPGDSHPSASQNGFGHGAKGGSGSLPFPCHPLFRGLASERWDHLQSAANRSSRIGLKSLTGVRGALRPG